MNVSAEIIASIFILIGTIMIFISAIGNLRLPDVYTRAHAAAKSTTLGVLGVLFGVFLYFLISEGYFSIRLILGIFFVYLTAPVSSHVIIRSAYRAHVPLADISVEDELKDYLNRDEKAGDKS